MHSRKVEDRSAEGPRPRKGEALFFCPFETVARLRKEVCGHSRRRTGAMAHAGTPSSLSESRWARWPVWMRRAVSAVARCHVETCTRKHGNTQCRQHVVTASRCSVGTVVRRDAAVEA